MKKVLSIVVLIAILGTLLFALTGCTTSKIADIVLTKENFEETTKKYTEEVGECDDAYYMLYATTKYVLKDALSVAFNMEMSNEEKMDASYKNVYGKTINQLIKEGRDLMQENNTTVEEFKTSLTNLSDSLSNLSNKLSLSGAN